MSNAKTFIPVRPAPKVSAFSSRGPNMILPSILKVVTPFSSQLKYEFIVCIYVLVLSVHHESLLIKTL